MMQDTEHHRIRGNLTALAKGSGVNFIGGALRQGLGFLFVVLLARMLPADDMGLYFLGMNIVTILAVAAMAGTDNGVRRFVSIFHGQKDPAGMHATVRTAMAVCLPLAAVLAIVLVASAGLLSTDVFKKPGLSIALYGLSPYIPFMALASVFLAATQGMKRMVFHAGVMSVGQPAVKVLLALALIAWGMGLRGAVFAQTAATGMAAVVAWGCYRKSFPMASTRSAGVGVRRFLAFSGPSALAGLLFHFREAADVLVVGYFLAAAQVGHYKVAFQLAVLGSVVVGSFSAMFAPIVSDLWEQGRAGELGNLYRVCTRWCFYISFPVFTFFMLFSAPALGFFGDSFPQAALCLCFLCIGRMADAATGPSGMVVLMSGHSGMSLANTVLALVSTVLFGILLTPRYGLAGAGAAVALSEILLNLARLVEVRMLIRVSPFSRKWLRCPAAAIPAGALAWAVQRWMGGGSTAVALAVTFGLFLGVYAGVLALMGLDAEDRELLAGIRGRIFRAAGSETPEKGAAA